MSKIDLSSDPQRAMSDGMLDIMAKHGGAAFPSGLTAADGSVVHCFGMSLRDWFATHCPEKELPTLTVGNVRKRFSLSNNEYGTDAQWRIMRCEARFAYADAMLKARGEFSEGLPTDETE